MPTSRVTCGNVIQGREQRESQGCAIVEHPSPRASYQPLACVLCSESEQVMLRAVITRPLSVVRVRLPVVYALRAP